MKNFKKVMVGLLAAAMAMSFVACGSNSDSDAETAAVEKVEPGMYRAHFDSSTTEVVPAYQFVGSDMSGNIPAGTQLDVTLSLKEDGTYKLYAGFTNENNPDTTDQYYCNIATNATGTYTIDGNKVTISAAETCDTTFEAGSDTIDNPAYTGCSFANGEAGTWSSTDDATVLECVPETTFTIVDGEITTWEAAGSATGNPND